MVFCDNVSAVYMSSNHVHHRLMKHIKIDIHFVRECDAVGELRVLHVPSGQQFTDIMTKGCHPQHSTISSPVYVSVILPLRLGGC
jgi:hypothetical protein